MTCHRALRLFAASLALSAAVACASNPGGRLVPPGTQQPDRFLFEKGTQAIEQRKWAVSREFFKQLTENYTQSTFRPDAKLAIGDSYLGEGSTQSLVLAINEFQEFLSFYPTHPRADYAQYKIGLAHHRQMRSPQRDQSETQDAVREFETFIARYPASPLTGEVTARLRESRDRLDEAEYAVGFFYFRIRNYPGAIERFQTILKKDPAFTGRDAVYFYLAESLVKIRRDAEALPYYKKVVDEFEQSEHLVEARRRADEVQAQLDKPKS